MVNCVVVEDFQPLREAFRRILDSEPDIRAVAAFGDGDELLRYLGGEGKDRAQVILLDIEMRIRKEGIKVCRILNRDFPALKVVMLTCHEEEDYIVQSLEAGAVDYVSKNSSPGQIVKAIRCAAKEQSNFDSLVSGALRQHLKNMQNYRQSMLICMNLISRLTVSEMEVLQLLLLGKSKQEIADIRVVEYGTVKMQTRNILHKIHCAHISELREFARECHLEETLAAMGGMNGNDLSSLDSLCRT